MHCMAISFIYGTARQQYLKLKCWKSSYNDIQLYLISTSPEQNLSKTGVQTKLRVTYSSEGRTLAIYGNCRSTLKENLKAFMY